MTATTRALRPAFVQAQLARLGLNEWAFIRECSRADRARKRLGGAEP